MLSKLKYIGTKTEDLLDVYHLYIRSVLEYCSVVFHSSLTAEQAAKLETVQRVALFAILGDNYVSHDAALEMSSLSLLSERREARVQSFCHKALKHPHHAKMFPINVKDSNREVRDREVFKVNYARTEFYQKSAVIQCQHILNKLAKDGKIKL